MSTLFRCLACCLAAVGLASWSQAPRPADTILVNGNVITVDDPQPRARAVAIAGGRILVVGTDAEVRAHETAATRVIDLGGRTVVPGLADNHFHSAGGGAGVDLSGARTLAEVLSAIAAAVREAAPGAVVVTNSDWHEGQLAEQRLPLRRDLEAVAPDHPVVVVRGGHEYVLNSAGLARWGITADTPVPAAGEISRYDDGALNGELIDAAKNLVSLDPPPPRDVETRIADQLAEHARLHAAGLTSIRHPGGAPDQYELLADLKRRGELRIRVNFLFRARCPHGGGARRPRRRLACGAGRRGRVAARRWRQAGVDGGFEGGWMREPYAEPFGRGGTFHGLQTMPADRFTMAVTELNRRGGRVATHAVGDAAIDQVLTGSSSEHVRMSCGESTTRSASLPAVSEGTPQGGPLSPLLSNLMLDVLDKELETRGHRFVRYADDCAPRRRRKEAEMAT